MMNRAGANARSGIQQKRPHPGKGEAEKPSWGQLDQLGDDTSLPAMLPGSPQGDTELSIRVMDLVWKRFPGSGSELLVLLACADWGNDQGGRIYPSVKALSTKIRVTEGQARRVLHGLIDGGWVHVVGNANGGRPGMTRQYQIDMAKLASSPVIGGVTTGADETPSDDATPGAYARDGLHGRQGGVAPVHKTGGVDASLTVKRTVIEPPREPLTPRARAQTVVAASLPFWLDAKAWADWCQHRRGKKWTDLAQQHSIRALGKLRDQGNEPAEVIAQSIAAGWTGLFALKNQSRSRDQPYRNGFTAYAERIADDRGSSRDDENPFLIEDRSHER